uniref:Uncharacterized protein n=1 Tax=Compsopogon caeruleus TaxID=31354 RepID=A0A7S1XDB2_9RHOD
MNDSRCRPDVNDNEELTKLALGLLRNEVENLLYGGGLARCDSAIELGWRDEWTEELRLVYGDAMRESIFGGSSSSSRKLDDEVAERFRRLVERKLERDLEHLVLHWNGLVHAAAMDEYSARDSAQLAEVLSRVEESNREWAREMEGREDTVVMESDRAWDASREEIEQKIHTIRESCLSSRSEWEREYAEYRCTKVDALTAKLDLVLARLESELYTPESAREIEEICLRLTRELEKARDRKNALSQELERYHSLGPEFMDLAAEYARLSVEDQTRSRIMRELQDTKE